MSRQRHRPGQSRAHRASRFALIFTAVATPACFAVEKIDPGIPDSGNEPCASLLLDDFEDGDPFPSPAAFGRWGCYTFNPAAGQTVSCDLEPGPDGGFALYAAFALQDAPNGIRDFPGVGLETSGGSGVIDFTPYRQLVFSAKVDSGTPALPLDTLFDAVLFCNSAPTTGPSADFADVRQSMNVTGQWQTFRLELASFAQPTDFEPNHIVGGAQSCLGLVDGIDFQLTATVADGEAASGRLHIDNIRLENDCQ